MEKAISKAHMLISKLQKKYGFKYKSRNYLSTEFANKVRLCKSRKFLKKDQVLRQKSCHQCTIIFTLKKKVVPISLRKKHTRKKPLLLILYSELLYIHLKAPVCIYIYGLSIRSPIKRVMFNTLAK